VAPLGLHPDDVHAVHDRHAGFREHLGHKDPKQLPVHGGNRTYEAVERDVPYRPSHIYQAIHDLILGDVVVQAEPCRGVSSNERLDLHEGGPCPGFRGGGRSSDARDTPADYQYVVV
jgi:hypothetical protein